MRHCDDCVFLEWEGYEYPSQYCTVGVTEDDPMFDGEGCRYDTQTLLQREAEIKKTEVFF